MALIVRLTCEGSHLTIKPLGLGIHYALTSNFSHLASLLLLYPGPVKPVVTSLGSPVAWSTPTCTVPATIGSVYQTVSPAYLSITRTGWSLVRPRRLRVQQRPTLGAHTHAHSHQHPCPWVLGGHGCNN